MDWPFDSAQDEEIQPFGPCNDEFPTSVLRHLTSDFWAGIELFDGLSVIDKIGKIKKYLKFMLTICRYRSILGFRAWVGDCTEPLKRKDLVRVLKEILRIFNLL